MTRSFNSQLPAPARKRPIRTRSVDEGNHIQIKLLGLSFFWGGDEL
ncbi:hypothetical protein Pla52o_23730 [Novipirellula galeiformis]|uniref:Uncharacterized protein n=1 Tax=Novipirellula galeiformis TaxID=2528004 RepID=A0A5C6CMX6_9BACT|nr:hypothetical protein Pla52o_23730 [Novipirellula galeiformis]